MITEAAAKHAGLVMAHAAAVASVIEPGELICPFVVVAKGDDRQSIEFPSKSQDEAIDRAWSSLSEYQTFVDLWAMAREGLVPGAAGKDDVLVVAAWGKGMTDAVVFTQRFLPKTRGGFRLFGPIMMQSEMSRESHTLVADWFAQGISQHPKGDRWQSWLSPNNSFESDARKRALRVNGVVRRHKDCTHA